MKEKQYEEWIKEMFEKYKSVLFLEKYHIKTEKNANKDSYLASKFNYPYLDINILYSNESLEDWKKDKKEHEIRIVHEFCHTITDPFYAIVVNWPTKEQIESARERLTDHIAQIVNKHFKLIK